MGVRKKSSIAAIRGQGAAHVAELAQVNVRAVHGITRRVSSLINTVTAQKPEAVWCALANAAAVPLKWRRYWAAQARLANKLT